MLNELKGRSDELSENFRENIKRTTQKLITTMKNTLDEVNSRLDEAEDLEDKVVQNPNETTKFFFFK